MCIDYCLNIHLIWKNIHTNLLAVISSTTPKKSDSAEYKRLIEHEERIARAIGALLKEDEEIEENNTLEKERNEHLLVWNNLIN